MTDLDKLLQIQSYQLTDIVQQSKFLYPQNKTQHEAASQRVPPRVVLLLTVLG